METNADVSVGSEVYVVSNQLASCVELTMDPNVSQDRRMEAYTACEQFKENSPLCAQCGLYLAQRSDMSHFVRHFGLQLMEHCVKYRWNHITQQEKLYIKENAMKLLGTGMDPTLTEHTHIKDGLSRVIVEMIKREWPQQWQNLLPELFSACSQGDSQTELVCFVFLRLVEDVALLQTLESNQRRKDIYQGLTMHMTDIFMFFMQLIKEHLEKFHNHSSLGQSQQALGSVLVIKAILLMFSGFVEWVNISHIMIDDLLLILCMLLDHEHFQLPAADCLLQLVNRKGNSEERKPLMLLFDTKLMMCIFNAAQVTTEKPLSEHNYTFLKKLAQVLTGLGTQLCTLWNKDSGPGYCPPNLGIYLEAMLALSQHPSLTLVHYANPLWMQFFKHEHFSKDALFLSFVPKWVEVTGPKILKVGYPSERGISPESAFSRLDYDSDEEFASFFHRCRTELLDTFRQATLIAPLVTFGYVERWLKVQIEKSQANPTEECTLQSPSYLQWEALSQLLDSVLSKILVCQDRPPVSSGLLLLELCLSHQPTDSLLLSALLSCISALFVFLSMGSSETISTLLPRVLDKIFGVLTHSLPGQTKVNRSRVVRNVRRHAASLMVKIGQKYPLLLLPLFDEISNMVKRLNKDPTQLSKMERVTLIEALLVIDNHFCDYARQAQFVGEVIAEGAGHWLAMSDAFKGPKEFMAFVGLDQPPVEPSSDDLNGQNRSAVTFCVTLFLAVVKRSVWPEDPERAQRGGFVASYTSTGNPVHRNPATLHVIPLLPNILALLKAFNALWAPKAQALLSQGYQLALNMVEMDRCNILGQTSQLPDPMDFPRNQTPLDRMQHFLSNIHDSCCHILGNAGPSLGRDFYQLQNLVRELLDSCFSNLENIPDFRLRPVVRVFLKPFVYYCPASLQETVVLPILEKFCPFMFARLDKKWQYLTQVFENGSMDEDNTDTQEVLEDMINRTLTREYILLLKVALLGGSTELASGDVAMDEGTDMKPGTGSSTEVLGELGILMLRSEATCIPVLSCLLRALSWNDTIACFKAAHLVGLIVRQVLSDGLVSPELASYVLEAVLLGLNVHGQHEANQGVLIVLGVQLYEMLRLTHPVVQEVMVNVARCSAADLKRLDDKIVGANQTGGNKLDKAKKDIFKKLTSSCIGRGTNQMYRKEVRIANLPSMDIPRRLRRPRIEPTPDVDAVALDLLFSH